MSQEEHPPDTVRFKAVTSTFTACIRPGSQNPAIGGRKVLSAAELFFLLLSRDGPRELGQDEYVDCLARLAKDPTRPVVPFKAALLMLIKQKKLLPTQITDHSQRNLLMLVIMPRNIAAMNVIFWLGLWRHYCDYKIPATAYGSHAGKTVMEFARSVVRSNKVTHELRILTEQEESLSDLLKAARVGDLKEVQRLIKACHIEDLKMALSKRDSQGNTVLHHACASGRLDVVRLFITFGCNLKAANHQENNLLHMTILHGSPAVLKELLKRKAVNVEEKNLANRTPAMLCAEMGSIRMMEMLIRAGAVVSQDLLGIAASKGCLPFIKYCVKTLGLHLAHVDSKRCTVLHHACSQSSVEMMRFLLESMDNKRDVLLARDHVGRTVIHACCDNVITNPETLVLLMKEAEAAGVLKEMINSNDYFTGCNTCVLVSGHDKGRAGFHYVLSHRDIVSLFEKRFRVDGVVDVSKFGEVIKSGWCDYPPDEVAKAVDEKLLLRATLDTAPKIDVTPLHLSIYKEKTEHAEKLIKFGADVNLKDCFGMTPLHLAAMRGNLPMVLALVKAGAEISVKDNKFHTPMDIAHMNEHEKIVNYFKGKDYMQLSQSFKKTLLQKLSALSPEKMQEMRENEVDVNQVAVRTLNDVQEEISEFLTILEAPESD